jgi:hypothetical protein
LETNSLDYYRGVFDTYAIQNDPGVNISYGFAIDDFSVESSLEVALKNDFEMFQELELTFAEITQEEFVSIMHHWLYIEFRPNFVNHLSTKDCIQQLVSNMIEDLQLTTFHKITSITQNGISKVNEFGYAVDFLILEAHEQRYLCEFTLG